MGRALANEYSVEVEAEGTFNDGTGIFSGSQAIAGVFGLDPTSARFPVIEDETYTLDNGTHEGIKGVAHPEISVPFSMHVEGLGTAAGDTVTASTTAQVELNAAALQCAPKLTTGSTVAATTTTTSVVEDADDAHAPDGTYTILPVTLNDGTIEARGGTYTGAADTASLTQALSSAPDVGNVIYGGALLRYVHTWAGAAGRSLQIRAIGNDTAQHFRLNGAVLERTMAAVGPQDVPTFAYNARAASFADLFSDTRATPTVNRRKVFAGGEIAFSLFGNTTVDAFQWLRIEFNDGISYIADEDGNNSDGIVGWTRAKSRPQVMLTIPHDAAALTGMTASSFRAAWRDGGADSLFQLCATYGRTAGASWTRFYPKLRLKGWSRVELDGLDAQVLTLEPATGLTNGELWVEKHW